MEGLGYSAEVCRDPQQIQAARVLILPGVGSFRAATERMRSSGIDDAVRVAVDRGAVILGICLGMQLLCSWSDDDGGTPGLDLVKARVSRFEQPVAGAKIRIPHVGFNSVSPESASQLFDGFSIDADFYFVHSFRVDHPPANPGAALAWTNHGGAFVAAFEIGRSIFGAQFHPELSHANGLRFIRNFLGSARC